MNWQTRWLRCRLWWLLRIGHDQMRESLQRLNSARMHIEAARELLRQAKESAGAAQRLLDKSRSPNNMRA